MPTRDPEKKANAAQRWYYRHRDRLLKAAKARYAAKRQDRIDYQHHYRSVVRQTAEINQSHPNPAGSRGSHQQGA